MNNNLFFVLFLEPLQLLLCLIVVKVLTFKLRVKFAILKLQFRYLSFKCDKLLLSKRKLLADNSSRTMLGD